MYPDEFNVNGGETALKPGHYVVYQILDHLGNVRHKVWLKDKQWIDDKGYEFKPFGESLGAESGASKGWLSLDNDYENNYAQLGYRTYDPNIGRFLQVDPMFEKFPGASPYNYCL